MKVKWEAFAKRRKYNLEMFQTLSYEEYSTWCDIRDVEPVSQEAYEGVQAMLSKEEVKPIASKITFDTKQLKKMRKSALVELSICLLYTSPSPRDDELSRMPSSA